MTSRDQYWAKNVRYFFVLQLSIFYLVATSVAAGSCKLLCKSEWISVATYDQILERVVLYDEDINGAGSRGFTDPSPPLFLAAESNNLVAVSALLKLGADVNIKTFGGWTPIFAAENLDIAKALIKAGADLNMRNDYGWVPLHIIKNEDVWFLLRDSGANIRLRNEVGVTTIMTAQSLKIFEFLLAEGLNPLEVALDQSNALFYSTSGEVIAELIKLGLDLNKRNKTGDTPLHKNPSALSIAYLISAGADIYARNEKGLTPLNSTWRNDGVLDVYCKTDPALFEERNREGNLLIHTALERFGSASNDQIEKIVQCTANLELTNGDGQTALHLAADGIYPEFVKILLDAGADAKATDKSGKTPFDVAKDNFMFDDKELLWELSEARFK